ncbi:hypothetical protein LTR16_004728, partial [Cryomyces antarcticus]
LAGVELELRDDAELPEVLEVRVSIKVLVTLTVLSEADELELEGEIGEPSVEDVETLVSDEVDEITTDPEVLFTAVPVGTA